MHRSHVSLRNRHRALRIMTAHSNGMSALQLQRHPGLGSCKSAWLLVQKIRRAMAVADGFPLIADVQADETTVPCRPKGSDPPRPGRNADGALIIAGAVEVFEEDKPGRVKLQEIKDQSGPTLKRLVEGATVRGEDRGGRLGRLQRDREPQAGCGRNRSGA